MSRSERAKNLARSADSSSALPRGIGALAVRMQPMAQFPGNANLLIGGPCLLPNSGTDAVTIGTVLVS